MSVSSAYENEDEFLDVKDVDFRYDINGKEHHTKKYYLMSRSTEKSLVVRRGQSFHLDLLLNRPYDATSDVLSFTFYVSDATKYGPSDVQAAAIPLLEKDSTDERNPREWTAVYEDQTDDGNLRVSITPAADCIVGTWLFDVDTMTADDTLLTYTSETLIYILFNPWCSDDVVYLSDDSLRHEYVEQDGGLIYRGVTNQIKPMAWNYAQYEKDILECALFLITDIGKVKNRSRSDAVSIVRALSAAVNINDDMGVLVGNWGSDFSDGTPPFDWVGSKTILQEYYKEKSPVSYAQCWVFAGVLTTVCRALGIPCRDVTCFNAAHDSHGSLTIDYIVDENGDELSDLTEDYIWNYHVWNEVWITRPDLGAEYNGWQVIDSTPQIPSGDLYRCGPTSLRAIKEGELNRPYDVPYVLAETNADKIFWKYYGKIQPLKLLSVNTTYVGQKISTKAVGKMEREDITDIYKYPEGTKEERLTLEKALRKSESKFARYYLNESFNDVTFDFELRDDIKIGQDFTVILHVKNLSPDKKHQVQGALHVKTVTYRGFKGNAVKENKFDFIIDPENEEEVSMIVTFEDYYSKLVDQASFNIFCMATIVDTKYDYFAQDDFRVRNPDIKINIDREPVVNEEFNVTVELENPLPIPLNGGKFYIEAPGLDEQLKITLDEAVEPGAVAIANFPMTAQWSGHHQITAKFASEELRDVDGFLYLDVMEDVARDDLSIPSSVSEESIPSDYEFE